MRNRRLVAAGLASATLLVFAAGPASAQHPPINIQFVSAKLVARGAAVFLTLSVQCDALPNDNNNDRQSFSLNGQLSEAVSRSTVTQGGFQFNTDPTQPDQTNTGPFCNGDPTGNAGTARTISMYVQPGGCCGGGGGGSSAPFQAGSAFLSVGASSCNYPCLDNQGNFTPPNGGIGQMNEGGGFQGQVSITRR